MDAKRRRQQIRRLLGGRELIYMGPRGTDALPLVPLGSLSAVFSFIAPTGSEVSETCIETISGMRIDLNEYTLNNDHWEPAVRFREAFFARLSRPVAVVPYSPSQTFSQGWLTAQDTVLPLGLFHEQQSCFDHKPWVESELRREGIATIPWMYVRTLSSSKVADLLNRGAPIVVRWPRSRGGAGIWLVRDRGDLDRVAEPPSGDRLFCVAPYFEGAVSVNVNACVFSEGEVSIHASSVQLVGVEICTPRPLGYVGNDFASIINISTTALQGLDSMTRSLGSWLARRGYLGAFGVDTLVIRDRVLFVELNPRFQASSAVATRFDGALGRPDQYLDHIAAFLGLGAADRLTLPELVKEQEPLSQIFVYNSRGEHVSLQHTSTLQGRDIQLLPAPGVVIAPNGTLATILWSGRVTETGRELRQEAITEVLNLLECFSSADSDKGEIQPSAPRPQRAGGRGE